ncbi:MAG: pyruvoyl-dependent arginine decarboxylase, partial [Caldilinea sp.]
MRLIPRKLFLTCGVGTHKQKLTSFELALRDAGIAHFPLVRVSSTFPSHRQTVTKKERMLLLPPCEIV